MFNELAVAVVLTAKTKGLVSVLLLCHLRFAVRGPLRTAATSPMGFDLFECLPLRFRYKLVNETPRTR